MNSVYFVFCHFIRNIVCICCLLIDENSINIEKEKDRGARILKNRKYHIKFKQKKSKFT